MNKTTFRDFPRGVGLIDLRDSFEEGYQAAASSPTPDRFEQAFGFTAGMLLAHCHQLAEKAQVAPTAEMAEILDASVCGISHTLMDVLQLLRAEGS